MTVIKTEKRTVTQDVPVKFRKTVKKYATYSAHVTVPFSWLGCEVEVALIDKAKKSDS
jgi:putative transposon-encoded protein